MAKVMRTPGVYIVEKNAFPNSVVEVATAVPAFIGYTEKAVNQEKSLLNTPRRITSMAEYHNYFGFGPPISFKIVNEKSEKTDKDPAVRQDGIDYFPEKRSESLAYKLYSSLLLFYQNGGGPCFIVSVGDYKATPEAPKLRAGIDTLIKEQEPTMVVIPDAVLLDEDGCAGVQTHSLAHCRKLQSRFAIIDVFDGYKDRADGDDCIERFRGKIGINALDYGAAYYPWIETTIVQDSELSFKNFDFASRKMLMTMIKAELGIGDSPAEGKETQVAEQIDKLDEKSVDDEWEEVDDATKATTPKAKWKKEQWGKRWDDLAPELKWENVSEDDRTQMWKSKIKAAEGELSDEQKDDLKVTSWDGIPEEEQDLYREKGTENLRLLQLTMDSMLHKSLFAMSTSYKGILKSIKKSINLLPPSAAMAGVYTMVDNTRGVWKAPANVSLNGVIRPAVNISHDEQEDLNVTEQGKSINAIRSFVGEGTLVWGGRTMDGNSLDWRYIQVRRTLIMLEQSMKFAAKAYVFEANDANTWTTMKSMASNFLTGIWKRGGLAGASPDDAFSVHVGLGETMIPEDILEGILRMTILVAPTRPAEFIEITFQQQMQKS